MDYPIGNGPRHTCFSTCCPTCISVPVTSTAVPSEVATTTTLTSVTVVFGSRTKTDFKFQGIIYVDCVSIPTILFSMKLARKRTFTASFSTR